jgi:hypothetical protein
LLPEISALNKACRNLRDFSSFNSKALNSIAFSATSDQSSSGISLISSLQFFRYFNHQFRHFYLQ